MVNFLQAIIQRQQNVKYLFWKSDGWADRSPLTPPAGNEVVPRASADRFASAPCFRYRLPDPAQGRKPILRRVFRFVSRTPATGAALARPAKPAPRGYSHNPASCCLSTDKHYNFHEGYQHQRHSREIQQGHRRSMNPHSALPFPLMDFGACWTPQLSR